MCPYITKPYSSLFPEAGTKSQTRLCAEIAEPPTLPQPHSNLNLCPPYPNSSTYLFITQPLPQILINHCSYYSAQRIWFQYQHSLIQMSSTNDDIYIQYIGHLLQKYPYIHILCLTDKSKSRNKTAYAYSVHKFLIPHRIRSVASIFIAELMAILVCLSHLTQLPPNGKFLLLTRPALTLIARTPRSKNSS